MKKKDLRKFLFVAEKQRDRIYEQVKTFRGQTEMAQYIRNSSAREDWVFKEDIVRIFQNLLTGMLSHNLEAQ